MKKITLALSIIMLMACLPATGHTFGINIDVPVPPPPVIYVPPPPVVVVEPPPPPAVVVEPVQPQEQYPQEQPSQDYQQQEQPQQEYPAEEYIPEGDPTPPPPLAIQNPDLVVVPGGEAQVYMVPNTVGVYFYGGTWYRYHHGVWFTAGIYNAPWVVVQTPAVPSFIVGISPAYALYLPPTYYRIHYNDFHRNWRSWDRERRWERENWYRNERRSDVRQARERHARERMAKDRQLRERRIKEREHRGHTGPAGPHKTGQFDNKKTGQQNKFDQKKGGQPNKFDQNKGGQKNKLDQKKTGTHNNKNQNKTEHKQHNEKEKH